MSYRPMCDGIGGRFTDPQAIRDHYGDVLAAGYITGSYAWTAEQFALFSSSVTIVTYMVNDGDVADCENGDLTPSQAGEWVRMRKASGYCRPTVYCAAENVSAVRTATGDLVLGTGYDIWCADWTGEPHECYALAPGPPALCAATQYAGNVGGIADLSAVYDPGWPHRTAPEPDPAPRPEEDTVANGLITGPAGSKQDIVCPAGKQPASITFGCSMPAEIHVDCRDGNASVERTLGYGGTGTVPWPAGENMIVVHVIEAASDGTPISWAY